jgi:hypothetical protein
MAKNETRLTRSCHFIWKPISKTLRITLEREGRRAVLWVGLESKLGLKDTKVPDGPELLIVEKTQPVEQLGPGDLECQLQDTSDMGQNTKHEGLESSSEDSLSDDEGSGSNRNCEAVGMAPSADEGRGQGVISTIATPVELHPREACLDMVLHEPVSPMRVEVSPLSNWVVPEPNNLPLMVYGGFEDEVDCSPIACEPLGSFLPPGSPLVSVVVCKGEGEVVKSQKSKRVDRHMSGFSKFVGFPIDDFEGECLALFQSIEESWNLQKRTTM